MPSRDFGVLQAYVDYLNSIFNQTITDSRLTLLGHTNRLRICRYQDERILPIELRPHGYLHFNQWAYVRDGKVIVEDCRYVYSTSADPDSDQEWIFRYEYCLEPEENVPYAHVHLNAICNNRPMQHIHFPIGRVSIEQIIAHLILEHGVTPRTPDWFGILEESHRGFVRRRTDPPLFP